jgi:hypothetical protein
VAPLQMTLSPIASCRSSPSASLPGVAADTTTWWLCAPFAISTDVT